MSLWKIFEGFLSDALNSAMKDFLKPLGQFLGNLLRVSFFIEELPGMGDTVVMAVNIQKAFYILYGFLTLLLVLKIIWKGTKVFVLWRDGDADTPPTEMLLGAFLAVFTAAAFPVIYGIAVDIVQSIANAISSAFFSGSIITIDGLLDAFLKNLQWSLTITLFGLIYALVLLWLIFTMIRQGVELLVFRLGIPFAVAGLIDSDGGAWKPYSQTLLREMATAIIRYLCLMLSMSLAASSTLSGLITAICFEMVAVKTPAMLAQFLSPKSGGGGVGAKVNAIATAVRLFAGG